MDASSLYFSQMKDVDWSTMGTAMETDENGATVCRSTRERNQWVLHLLLFQGVRNSFAMFYKHIFAHMKNEGIAFEQANFTGIEGT